MFLIFLRGLCRILLIFFVLRYAFSFGAHGVLIAIKKKFATFRRVLKTKHTSKSIKIARSISIRGKRTSARATIMMSRKKNKIKHAAIETMMLVPGKRPEIMTLTSFARGARWRGPVIHHSFSDYHKWTCTLEAESAAGVAGNTRMCYIYICKLTRAGRRTPKLKTCTPWI